MTREIRRVDIGSWTLLEFFGEDRAVRRLYRCTRGHGGGEHI